MTLHDLIGLAGKATPGPWDADVDGTIRSDDGAPVCLIDANNDADANEAYIAVCSPEVVTALAKAAGALSETLRVLEACTTVEYSAAIKQSARAALSELRAAGIEQE